MLKLNVPKMAKGKKEKHLYKCVLNFIFTTPKGWLKCTIAHTIVYFSSLYGTPFSTKFN
jgi:hypothetical protein